MFNGLKIAALTTSILVSCLASAGSSTYTSVDIKKCSTLSEGDSGAHFLCSGDNGPLGPIQVEIFSGDNDNVNFIHAGKKHLAWEYINSVGPFSSVGGKNKVFEWVKDDSGDLRGIIFRVEAGTDASNFVSKLVVLGVTKYELCHLGTVQTNEQARNLAQTGYCGELLPQQ